MTQQKERPSTVNHLKETIQILNQGVQDPAEVISDSTTAAVAVIAITEVERLLSSWARAHVVKNSSDRNWEMLVR